MCCPLCERFEACYSAATLRHCVFPMAGLPPDHYVLCRTTEPCNQQCRSCSFQLEAMTHPPHTITRYHCCHRCKEFATCTDFEARHLEGMDKYKAVGTKGAQTRSKLGASQLALRRSTQSLRRASHEEMET